MSSQPLPLFRQGSGVFAAWAAAQRVACVSVEVVAPDVLQMAGMLKAGESVSPLGATLRGKISGLTAHGLELQDAMGHVQRSASNATEFRFQDGDAYLAPEDQLLLRVMCHPLGLRCRASTKTDSSGWRNVVRGTSSVEGQEPRVRACETVFALPCPPSPWCGQNRSSY